MCGARGFVSRTHTCNFSNFGVKVPLPAFSAFLKYRIIEFVALCRARPGIVCAAPSKDMSKGRSAPTEKASAEEVGSLALHL